jgi:hypothetical protein
VLIFSQKFFLSARLFMGGDSLFMLTTQDPTPRENAELFYEENRLRLVVRPSYSPGLAPSDFFLFGYIKHFPSGIAFPSRQELLAAIHEIVGAILRPTLEDVFLHWMERPECVSHNNDDYYP